jgi:hypothetical protein
MEVADLLAVEVLKVTAYAITVKEAKARLEGELAALRSRPWWAPNSRHLSILASAGARVRPTERDQFFSACVKALRARAGGRPAIAGSE